MKYTLALDTLALVLALTLLLVPACKADSVTDNLAAMLTADSSMPLGPGVAIELADNLMIAQQDSSYAASEPDSLTLSFASVLRAISLENYPGGPSEILNASNAPLPFAQSTIAIDDRASLSIYVDGVLYQPGEVIDFGSVPVVTPEPTSFIMLLTGLVVLLIAYRRKLHEK